ncbi:PilZ domain-containing protein [Planococcus versutus]|uniref:PilZ domain-containing protein n=1 Tax=Planococcus versutus TaxID=1302659 RepID=A0A1B1S3E1_9BACL|nr:PilZ domain-containing protein [Planococcus versutus]ANU27727.1 PilZ domain-containing protein [Planococcus versutus]
MFYKRLESFRYAFGTPPEIQLQIRNLPTADSMNLTIYGLLLDISPKGAKIFVEKERTVLQEMMKLKFVLNHEIITVEAKLIWKKPCEEGWLYGANFERSLIKEMLIVNEIKELKEIESN